jgi:hypothetical protein
VTTGCYGLRADPQSVHIVDFPRRSSVEDERLETDMPSASSGMDAVERHETPRGPSVGYCENFSTTPVSQPQLCHVNWLLSEQCRNDLHSRLPLVLHFLCHEEAISVIETRSHTMEILCPNFIVPCIVHVMNVVACQFVSFACSVLCINK